MRTPWINEVVEEMTWFAESSNTATSRKG